MSLFCKIIRHTYLNSLKTATNVKVYIFSLTTYQSLLTLIRWIDPQTLFAKIRPPNSYINFLT